MVAKLKEGAKVADVGCGYGHSTVLMAQAFPKSRFWGFDVHEGSIEAARKVASDAGVADCTVFDATCLAHRLAKSSSAMSFGRLAFATSAEPPKRPST